MKKYVPRLKEYEKVEFDEKKAIKEMRRLKSTRRKPTSVALEESTLKELKKIADDKDIPYQVLMRMFIHDGIERIKKHG